MIYFDNAATTKLLPEVLEEMMPFFLDEFGNPSSKYYHAAKTAKNAVDQSRQKISNILKCKLEELIFTSGATESNNLIIKGVLDNHLEGTVITSPLEHSSVVEILKNYAARIKVVYTELNSDGTINLNHFLKLFKENNNIILTTINFVNSDTGIVQDIEKLSLVANEYESLFHSDITQSIGKIAFDFNRFPNVDFISFSAHKFHGPKGIGAAVIKKDLNGLKRKLIPLHHGGDQEYGFRAGTLNTPGIVGMAKAFEIATSNLIGNCKYIDSLDNRLIELSKSKENLKILNLNYNRLPGYISLRISGINNELFLKKISNSISASTGSACSNNKPSDSLIALGHELEEIRETIRISINHLNNIKEVETFMSLFY